MVWWWESLLCVENTPPLCVALSRCHAETREEEGNFPARFKVNITSGLNVDWESSQREYDDR